MRQKDIDEKGRGAMGITYAMLKVKKSLQDKDFIEVKLLVDSGAVCRLVPSRNLEK